MFAALMSAAPGDRVAAYNNAQWRADAWNELNAGGFLPPNWDTLCVAECATDPSLIGISARALSEARGGTPLDAILELAMSDNLETRFTSVLANNDDEAIGYLLPRDNVLYGLADSGAHVSQLCDACFATDLLGNWVRDRNVMPIERAIHKLSAEPAGVYGFTDRGTLAPGKRADVVVFDPLTVAPGPLRRIRDFPANGERLTADAPVGMTHTFVNGTQIRADGQVVEEAIHTKPGRVLRSAPTT